MRTQKLAGRLELPLLVTHPTNVRYLTGLASSNAAVLVEPDGGSRLYTDFRYLEKARALEVELVETSRYLYRSLSELLTGRRVGFEPDHVTLSAYRTLEEGGVELVATSGAVEALRAVKEPGELEALRGAAALSDEVFAALAQERFTGRSERDLAWWVERMFRELGAEAVSFAPIVAAGVNGASPHAAPTGRVVEGGTLVTVDAGCVVDGYCSDCTRTFAAGEPPARLREAYELCLEAQLAGLAAVRAGVSGREADAASRVPVEAAGLGPAYGHGLGHGVGLDVHEAPVLRPESTDVLEQANTVTVEPGIYLPDEGGVRIEDLVVVTSDGCERLTRFPKELVTVA